MSRLRRPFLYDRYFFVTVKLSPRRAILQGQDFKLLALSIARMRPKHGLTVQGASATADIRVILLWSGAAGARVRGLDLGADDVVTRPLGSWRASRPGSYQEGPW